MIKVKADRQKLSSRQPKLKRNIAKCWIFLCIHPMDENLIQLSFVSKKVWLKSFLLTHFKRSGQHYSFTCGNTNNNCYYEHVWPVLSTEKIKTCCFKVKFLFGSFRLYLWSKAIFWFLIPSVLKEPQHPKQKLEFLLYFLYASSDK